ncbi:MAG TPA: DMT family transporter [Chthoniobacterales bacterium]|jgi:drug/metabolite transporter (DMT)-like permease|nr:DMT family transporter [Chthoniobacterales bacterium]
MTRTFLLTGLAMLAFASNSLLCRLALKETAIDAASFTLVRIVSGALCLAMLVWVRQRRFARAGNWISALALFGYAALFSFAYLRLSAGTGALLLFGAVQATMIIRAFQGGERLRTLQWLGLLIAIAGLVVLVFPGLSAPPLSGAVLMLGAGVAWGIYSLRGKGNSDPLGATAGNFVFAVPMALLLSLATFSSARADVAGIAYAVASGAIASGIGYAIWYSALPGLRATAAGSVQLSVPVLAALGGIIFLSEPITLRLVLASLAVLGGIGLVLAERRAS